jgi:hypothetical protein
MKRSMPMFEPLTLSSLALLRPRPVGASSFRVPFGLIVCSAWSRSRRAISIASPLSTSRAASSSTSCCAERISASMISTARSFWWRLISPAIRYQQLVARSWGPLTSHGAGTRGHRQCLRKRTPLKMSDWPARASRWWRTFLCAVVGVVLLTTAGCSSVSICLEQEKGVSASEDAKSQGCAPNRPTRSREREQEMRDGQARSGVANRTEKLHRRG